MVVRLLFGITEFAATSEPCSNNAALDTARHRMREKVEPKRSDARRRILSVLRHPSLILERGRLGRGDKSKSVHPLSNAFWR